MYAEERLWRQGWPEDTDTDLDEWWLADAWFASDEHRFVTADQQIGDETVAVDLNKH